MPYHCTVQPDEYRTHVLLVAAGVQCPGVSPVVCDHWLPSLVCLWDECQGTACPGWGRCSVFSGLSSQERVGVEHSTSSHYIQDICLFARVLHNRAAAKYLFSCSWLVWFDAYWCSSTQCFMSINRKELCCSTILIEITVKHCLLHTYFFF